MDGSLAIEANREALKRVVAQLVEMAGMAEPPTSPSMGVRSGRPQADRKPTVWLPERRTPGAIAKGRPVATQSREGVNAGEDAQGGLDSLIANAPRDPLTASLRSAPLPLKGGEEGRPPSQPPIPLPRRSGERWSAKPIREGVDRQVTPTRRPGVRRPPHKGEVEAPAKLLPRILWRAILKILLPAEAAARRLVIAAARGLVVPPPRLRKPAPKPINDDAQRRRLGLAVMFRPADPAGGAPAPAASRRAEAEGGAAVEGGPRIPAFCLFDPPRRLALFGRRRARICPPHAAPRIIYPGLAEPHRLPPPPAPHDPIDARRVIARIASLSAALDDLAGQARRFARWKARSAAARRREAGGEWKPRRLTPIRRGRLPGGRLWRFDPVATRPANIREVDEILAHAHALATYALDYPDTS